VFVALALEAFYKTNEFRITITPLSAGPTLSYPPKLYHSFLRRLELSVDNCEIGSTLSEMPLSHRSGRRVLLAPTGYVDPHQFTYPSQPLECEPEEGTAWQENLVNLTELSIVMFITDDMPRKNPTETRCWDCGLPVDSLRDVVELLGETEMRIKAPKAEVILKSNHRVPRDCACLAPLKDVIRDMAMNKKRRL
jgi:hypothetical protein